MPGRYAKHFFMISGLETDVANCGYRQVGNHEMKIEEHHLKFPNERTPRNLQDLNFSPSWMDPGSMHMMSLAGQHPGFYTPNSGGMGAIFHNQAGDLHTPTVGLNTITPLSLSNPIAGPQHGAQPVLEHFNPQYLAQHMPGMNSYTQQATFAPSAFMQRDSGYDVMDETVDDSSINGIPLDQASNMSAVTASEFSVSSANAMGMAYTSGEK